MTCEIKDGNKYKVEFCSTLIFWVIAERKRQTERKKIAECQYALNNRISEIIAVFFHSCWALSGGVLHNDSSQGGGGCGGNSGGCVAAAKVVVKGGVVVTGAEIQLRRQGRQRFNLLKGDFNCYTAN